MKDSGGVRLYTHYEQIVQIFDYGLDNILTEIVQSCIEMNWSDGSASYLIENFVTDRKSCNWQWI